MLTHRSQSAIRAAVALARIGDAARVASHVSRDAAIPRPYLLKLLGAMARRGLLEARRGPGGGFRLAKPAAALRLTDIVAVFQDESGPMPCLLVSRPCGERVRCPAHSAWRPVQQAYQRFLESTTIADLMGDPCARDAFPQSPRRPWLPAHRDVSGRKGRREKIIGNQRCGGRE